MDDARRAAAALEELCALESELQLFRVGQGRCLHHNHCGHVRTAQQRGRRVLTTQVCRTCGGALFSKPVGHTLYLVRAMIHVDPRCARGYSSIPLTLCEQCHTFIPAGSRDALERQIGQRMIEEQIMQEINVQQQFLDQPEGSTPASSSAAAMPSAMQQSDSCAPSDASLDKDSGLQTADGWELVGSERHNPGGASSSSGGVRPLNNDDLGNGVTEQPRAVSRAHAAGEISLGRVSHPRSSPSPDLGP